MFFVMRFNRELFSAARSVGMAIQRDDPASAISGARAMGLAVLPLVHEAESKARGALISGNDEVYASMALQAQMVVDAAGVLMAADLGNGIYDPATYQRGATQLMTALASPG